MESNRNSIKNEVNFDFYNIREFACKNFYSWEYGEDFDWLRKEWPKFEPFLKSEFEVHNFILTLAYIYNAFCFEAYFERSPGNALEKDNLPNQDHSSEPRLNSELKERIEIFHNRTLDILLEVYTRPTEIAREFVSIAIGFELPHEDGIMHIYRLYKDKWNPYIEDTDGGLPF